MTMTTQPCVILVARDSRYIAEIHATVALHSDDLEGDVSTIAQDCGYTPTTVELDCTDVRCTVATVTV
jgi:hypothetical protein